MNDKKPNDLRISFNTRISRLVSYCKKLVEENKEKTLNFSAVGGSIGTLINAVEVIKTLIPDLYQINRLATISYQSMEDGKPVAIENKRLYPKLEVVLTKEKPEKTSEGFQEKLSEEDRKKLLEILNKRKDERKNYVRGGSRGRGFRGRRRGGFRGGFRGRRTGFRGRRMPTRGFRARRGFRTLRRVFRGGRGRRN